MGIEFSKVTGVKVFVTQAQYESGQDVSGEVFVNLLSEIKFSKLKLEISGVEAINYRSLPHRQNPGNGDAGKSEEVKAQKELFRAHTILYEPPEGRLPPGHYRFPFLFVLPPGLPGSASVAGADVGKDEAGEYNADVKYLLYVEFENCFILAKDSRSNSTGGPTGQTSPQAPAAAAAAGAPAAAEPAAPAAAPAANAVAAAGAKKEPVTLEAKDAAAPPSPQPAQGAEDVQEYPLRLFDMLELFIVEKEQTKAAPHVVDQTILSKRCLPCMKSDAVVGALVLNNTYLTGGDVFEVNVEVENPSRHILTEIILAVWRITTLRAPGQEPYVVRNRMLYQQVSSVPPGLTFRGQEALHVNIQIPNDLQQTVKASLLEVQYEVALTADLRKSGMDIRDNLTVRKSLVPQPEHLKGIKAPPGWANTNVTTEIKCIQIEGASPPNVGNYEGIGYVRPAGKGGP